MKDWTSDKLSDLLEKYLVTIQQGEELPAKIVHAELARDEHFNILLHTYSSAEDRPKAINRELGEVYKLDNKIEMQGAFGTGSLHGAALINVQSSYSSINQNTATHATYSVHKVLYEFIEQDTSYVVDNIANLPNSYLWPYGMSEIATGETVVSFGSSREIEIKTPHPKRNYLSRRCARFSLGGQIAILVQSPKETENKVKNAGFIFFAGHPDESTRKKIRYCISLTFGIPLVYLGANFYSGSGHLNRFEAISPATLGGKVWSFVSQPLAPITAGRSNMLDEAALQRLAESFYDSYSESELENLCFRFWHAEASPHHMKAAYYGAIIESIQTNELKKPGSGISRTIVNKSQYRNTAKALRRFLAKQNLPEDIADLFKNKIDNANSAPQRIVSQRFYDSLGLTLGSLENSSWNQRNNAAHGNLEQENQEIENFRLTKVLRVILARILLKFSGGADFYIDYYTLGHPWRELPDPIEITQPS